MMANNYKHLYEQMKKIVCMYQDEIVPLMRKNMERLGRNIVRCADCQHCALDYADQGFGYPSKPVRVCIIHDHETTLDDYCSWARRKDGGEE